MQTHQFPPESFTAFAERMAQRHAMVQSTEKICGVLRGFILTFFVDFHANGELYTDRWDVERHVRSFLSSAGADAACQELAHADFQQTLEALRSDGSLARVDHFADYSRYMGNHWCLPEYEERVRQLLRELDSNTRYRLGRAMQELATRN